MKKKQFLVFILSLLAVTTHALAENLILDNQTSYPIKNSQSQIAIQWASSANEVQVDNDALMNGNVDRSSKLHVLPQTGMNTIDIPENAEYFRVLVWSTANEAPDLHTNWVDVTPKKVYTLKNDQLIPIALMSGTGC